MELIENTNYIFALGTVLLQVLSFALLIVFIFQKRVPLFRDVAAQVGAWGLWAAFGVTFAASVMAIFYSDVLGFDACPLCWWQRVFLVPQVFLLGLAAWKRDAYMAEYSIILSIFGAAIALYQHVLQMMPGSGLPCPATGTSCALRILFEFGYITFPLMAFSVFAFLIILMLFVRSKRD